MSMVVLTNPMTLNGHRIVKSIIFTVLYYHEDFKAKLTLYFSHTISAKIFFLLAHTVFISQAKI